MRQDFPFSSLEENKKYIKLGHFPHTLHYTAHIRVLLDTGSGLIITMCTCLYAEQSRESERERQWCITLHVQCIYTTTPRNSF